MKRAILIVALVMAALMMPTASAAGVYDLWDWCTRSNGAQIGCNGGPANAANVGGNFDYGFSPNGLGTITVSLTAGNNQSVLFFLDFDIDSAANGSFNEFATVNGGLPGNAVYEVANPASGLFGRFDTDSPAGTNSVGVPGGPPNVCCDVALILGFKGLNLSAGQKATISLKVAKAPPTGGFYIQQTDSDTQNSLYYILSLNVTGGPGGPGVPEPSSIALMSSGLLLGLVALRRRMR